MARRSAAIGVLGVLALALGIASCASATPPSAPALPVDPMRFPHALAPHAAVTCEACHGDVTTARRPAHAACADAACHAAGFAAAARGDSPQVEPAALCVACHPRTGDAALVPLPRVDSYVAMPSAFDHRLHLDADRLEAAVGFHLGCSDCHPRDAAGPTLPSHPACARCHADEVALARGPRMAACTACHRDAAAAPRHAQTLIVGDLRFDHAPHQRTSRGDLITCTACHGGAATTAARRAMPAPTIAACVECHDDASRVPAGKRMRICETCHTAKVSSLRAIAPRDHLPPTERPRDHTLAFRFDHAGAASRDAGRCAGCHTQMSGAPAATCDECHQVMRPGDHTVVWTEFDHGPRAATDRDRCATCHGVDYCVACHAQRPRSHLPTGSFSGAGHAAPARRNPRACVTCHDPVDACAACHVDAGARR